jgi:hypothetical protein
MTVALDADTIRRAKSAAALLASENAGEREAALFAIGRLVPAEALCHIISAGLGDHRTAPASAQPLDGLCRWQRCARTILRSGMSLSEWERRFLSDVAVRVRRPSERQQASLNKIVAALAAWEVTSG